MKRSYRAGPNDMAAGALMAWHKSESRFGEVRRICKETLPHIDGDDERYKFMSECIEDSGAADIRGGLDWASRSERRWYINERERRRQQEIQRQRAEQRRQEQMERQAKYCVADCKERGNLCMRDCYTEQCKRSCNGAYRACLDKCEAELGE